MAVDILRHAAGEGHWGLGDDAAATLGGWIWLNLITDDVSYYFRWVASTRRFASGPARMILEDADPP